MQRQNSRNDTQITSDAGSVKMTPENMPLQSDDTKYSQKLF